MKIFYWSPFLSNVATISSVIRSAESILNYSKKNNNLAIIDSVGEWEQFYQRIDSKIRIIKLYKNSIYKLLPRGGFIKSRFSQIIIFFYSFFKLLKLIKKEEPEYIIANLITSLPIFLSIFYNNKTRIILRISGLPKLHIFRLFFWKIFSKKIYRITCPTEATCQRIKKLNVFDNGKIFLLRDPAIQIKNFANRKREKITEFEIKNNEKFIIAIGRLTRQKNFSLLIDAFSEITKKYPHYKLIILGEGEEKSKLEKKINEKKIEKKIFLLGLKKNVYKYLSIADCLIMTSLWEDPGFAILEAALCNTSIIASDCPNGPIEILENGKNGYLFENNNLQDLLAKFEEFQQASKLELQEKKISAKKKIIEFGSLNHFNSITRILN